MPGQSSRDLRTRGYAIRIFRLSDTSLIVEWLTREEGRVETVARGALRPKSPLAGKLDICFLSDIHIRRSRRARLHHLREAELVAEPRYLRRSLESLERMAYCAALIRSVTETETPIPEIYALFGRILALTEGGRPTSDSLLWFEWLLLGSLGIQPPAEQCPVVSWRTRLENWRRGEDYQEDPDPDPNHGIVTGRWFLRTWNRQAGPLPRSRSKWFPSPDRLAP